MIMGKANSVDENIQKQKYWRFIAIAESTNEMKDL